jgi:hypothetical protein
VLGFRVKQVADTTELLEPCVSRESGTNQTAKRFDWTKASLVGLSMLTSEGAVDQLLAVLKETMEGPGDGGSYFLDPNTGLLKTLETLSLEQVFASAAPGRPSIAAHVKHTVFHLRVICAWPRGDRSRRDWPASFVLENHEAATWVELLEELKLEYADFQSVIREFATRNDQDLGGAVGGIVHVAYHLGAIRQLIQLV